MHPAKNLSCTHLGIENRPIERTVDPTFMLLVKLLAFFFSPQKFSHSYNKELVAQNLLMNSLDKHHVEDKNRSKGPRESLGDPG